MPATLPVGNVFWLKPAIFLLTKAKFLAETENRALELDEFALEIVEFKGVFSDFTLENTANRREIGVPKVENGSFLPKSL